MNLILLDQKGIISAFLLGLGVYYSGGIKAISLLCLFLLIGNFVTNIGKKTKKKLKIMEYSRSWKNVISNGLIPLIFCYLGYEKAFVCSIAAITADKFGSELGVLFGAPISLEHFKRVIEGTSGAISTLGTLFSITGALIIAIFAYALGYKYNIFFVTFSGFIGCFADSVAGVFEEKGIGTKETSNIICAAVGGLIGRI